MCVCVCVQTKTINIMYAVSEDVQGLVKAIDVVCMKAAQAARDGYQLIVLSDKLAGKRLVPIRCSLSLSLSLSVTHWHSSV